MLRRRGRILQSAPSLVTKVNALLFMLESAALRRAQAAAHDADHARRRQVAPGLHRVIAAVTRFVNRFLGGDLRWQTLPVPFEVYADGIDLVVFEEFGAGQAALHLADEVERNELMQDEAYRRRFRKDYEKRYSPRVWQRDFHDAQIVACPDASLVGRSFGEVADARGVHPVDAYLDLVVEHGAPAALAHDDREPSAARESSAWCASRPRSSASPTRARTSATWRSTAFRCGCCASCATPSARVGRSCRSSARCGG